MPKLMNIAGREFGRLVVIREVGRNRHGKSTWLCECKCGAKKVVIGSFLINGHTTSCGCAHREQLAARQTTHGHTRPSQGGATKEYVAWGNMKKRCLDPDNKDAHSYGGRGIEICPEWLDSFEEFFSHVGPAPSAAHTLDRIRVNEGYKPGNVRWVVMARQSRNTRRNTFIATDNEVMCLTDWAKQFGLHQANLRTEIKRDGLEEVFSKRGARAIWIGKIEAAPPQIRAAIESGDTRYEADRAHDADSGYDPGRPANSNG